LIGLLFALLGVRLLLRACAISFSDLAVIVETEQKSFAIELGLQQQAEPPTLGERIRRRFTSWTNRASPRARALAAIPNPPREFWMRGREGTKIKAPPPPVPPAQPPLPRQPSPAPEARPVASRQPASEAFVSAFLDWARSRRGKEDEKAAAHDAFDDDPRIEPFFGPGQKHTPTPPPAAERNEATDEPKPSSLRRFTEKARGAIQLEKRRILGQMTAAALAGSSRGRSEPDEPDDDFDMPEIGAKLPPLSLLSEPRPASRQPSGNDPALMERASMLMEVLGDFGVKG